MNETESSSLQYLMSRTEAPKWAAFLRVLADELNAQMSVEDIRAFFFVLGQRLGEAESIGEPESLDDLESLANQYFDRQGWGILQIRDVHTSLELVHHCAPLRAAFGDQAMKWSGGLLEGIYTAWLEQMGAGGELQLRQIGEIEGGMDTMRFRLAHESMFS